MLTPRITRKVLGRCFPSSPLASPRGSAPTHKGSFSSLTPREAEVASLVADGFSNAEIAERLVVEPASVRRYVSRILAKTNKDDSAQTSESQFLPERTEENHPPEAVDDSFGVRPGRSTILPVLANDTDQDGDVLTAVPGEGAAGGTVSQAQDGLALRLNAAEDASGTITTQ